MSDIEICYSRQICHTLQFYILVTYVRYSNGLCYWYMSDIEICNSTKVWWYITMCYVSNIYQIKQCAMLVT